MLAFIIAGMITSFFQSLGGSFGSLCGILPQCTLVILGLKVVVLLFLIGWVRSHLGSGILPTLAMLVIGYLILFQYWFLFGPLSIIYIIAILGGLNLFVTFIFTKESYVPGLVTPRGEEGPPGHPKWQKVRPPPGMA